MELEIDDAELAYVWGSPVLGMALILARRQSAADYFSFLAGVKR